MDDKIGAAEVSPTSGVGAGRLQGPAAAVRSYLSTRFPLVPQGGTVLSAYVCSYLLYGQAAGGQTFRWPALVGGIAVVLLALVRRIVDDVEDLREDIRNGRFSFEDDGRRYLRGLIAGALAATAAAAALNAAFSPALGAAVVATAAWFPLAMAVKNKTAVARSRALRYVVVESCPAAFLLYGYLVWTVAADDSLPLPTVIAVVGLFWTTYQFWNFTRKAGVEGWPPWGLTIDETKPALLFLLALAAGFSGLVFSRAQLPVGYLLYAIAVSVAFAAIVLRWWSRLPSGGLPGSRAAWGGLPFAVLVEAGVVLAVLAA